MIDWQAAFFEKGETYMSRRNLLSLTDMQAAEIASLIERTLQRKNNRIDAERSLTGKAVGIYFRKTSTRTRTAFTLGASKLGASVMSYGPGDLQTNTGETLQDTAHVLSGYLDALVLRTAESLDEMKILATRENMSVINAMSDQEHPTQALSDLATMQDYFGHLDDLHILYLGEGNSTAAALALAISRIPGMKLTLLTPDGYALPEDMYRQARVFAGQHQASIEEYHTLDALPKSVDVVYTARWQTTGSSKTDPDWREHFKPFSVNPSLMKRVTKSTGTIFMHDLPAVRNEEVAPEVLDGPQSIAFRQAHTKLFGAMAALEWCILGE
jgi:ornithine carbamoyltransferase